MKNFFLIPNVTKDAEYLVTKNIIKLLNDRGASIYVEAQHQAHLNDVTVCDVQSMPKEVEAMIVLGGDGSVIHAAPLALQYDLPLLGVNLGFLGYLTGIELDEIEKLLLLVEDHFEIVAHSVLSVQIVKKDGKIIEQTAVNDVVVGKNDQFSLADISLTDVALNSVKLDYRADGLIVCTPLGSTAYSLSAGGPIIDSMADTFCVTPICPHSLFSRSILFTPQSVLKLINESRHHLSYVVNVDGKNIHTLLPDEHVLVSVSDKKLTFIRLGNHGVLDVLRHKMLISDIKH